MKSDIENNRNNPFTLTFGKYPANYISRYENIDTVISSFDTENPVSQIYMIEGVRGSGKTVLMTAISRELGQRDNWIIVDINSARDIMDDLAHRLYDTCSRIPRFMDKGFNITIAGVGVGLGGVEGFGDSVSTINHFFEIAGKKNKRILITIDEVIHNEQMKVFASQFQIWLRQDYPIYLLMTGLYENLHSIQNDPALTFLLRTPKIRLEPLSIRQIMMLYEKLLEVDSDRALYLARITKGYAFAFQALGVLYWKKGKDTDIEDILEEFDLLLEDFAYRKIWEGLSENERKIVLCMDEGKIKAEHIIKRLGMAPGTFSTYRQRLIKSGIILPEERGYVSLALPRFAKVAKYLERE